MDNSKKNSPEQKAPAVASPFPHREDHVARHLGISRDHIRELRATHLTEGTHWKIIGKPVMLSEEAVTVLAQALQMFSAPSVPAPEKIAAPTQPTAASGTSPRALIGPPGNPSAIVTLKAWHSPDRNVNILEAYFPGTDPRNRQNLVKVRVRSNRNYVQHMELPAKPMQGGLYEVTRPDPRTRGRW